MGFATGHTLIEDIWMDCRFVKNVDGSKQAAAAALTKVPYALVGGQVGDISAVLSPNPAATRLEPRWHGMASQVPYNDPYSWTL